MSRIRNTAVRDVQLYEQPRKRYLPSLISCFEYLPLVMISSSADFLPRNIFPSGLRNHCIDTFPALTRHALFH